MIDIPPKPAIIIPKAKELIRVGEPKFVIPAIGVFAVPRSDARPPFNFSYLTSVKSASGTLHSFAGVDFGVANSYREIILAIGFPGTLTGDITVEGTVATLDADVSGSIIARVAIPSGTTGAFSFSTIAATVASVAVYRMVNGVLTDSKTNTAGSGAVSVAPATVAGGAVVGNIRTNQVSVSDTTWTAGGLTRDVMTTTTNSNNKHSAASLTPTATSAALTITASQSGTGGVNALAAVSYQPGPS